MAQEIGVLRYVEGDATRPLWGEPWILAHVCNDVGKWGAGFTAAISGRWPRMGEEFRWPVGKTYGLGEVEYVQVGDGCYVANMFAQHGVRGRDNPRPLDDDALETCLGLLAARAVELGAAVHMPFIGCGLAGGRWSDVEPKVRLYVCDAGVDVTVYQRPGDEPMWW